MDLPSAETMKINGGMLSVGKAVPPASMATAFQVPSRDLSSFFIVSVSEAESMNGIMNTMARARMRFMGSPLIERRVSSVK